MAPERRKQILILGGLILASVLAIAAYRAWPRQSAAAASASNGRGAGDSSAARATPAALQAPRVHLPDLEAERPKPVAAERNLFRFKVKPPPPPPSAATTKMDRTLAAPVPSGPPPPPPVPPITLKFIGIIDQGGTAGKIAALKDDAGHVFQGREGDIIEGRYRILKIGVESIELAYLDGTGRRSIRLTGS